MEIFGANPVDVVVLVIVVVSALLALMRGFVAEVFSIIGWAAAVAAVLYGLSWAEPHMARYLGEGMIATVAAAGALFIGTLAVVSTLSYIISRSLHKTHLSAIDRSLGFLFGLFRGAFLVCLLFICITFVFPLPKAGEQPETGSLQEVLLSARTSPALVYGAKAIASFAPHQSLSIEDLTKVSPLERLMQPQPEGTVKDKAKGEAEKPTGYEGAARKGLEQMLESMGSETEDTATGASNAPAPAPSASPSASPAAPSN